MEPESEIVVGRPGLLPLEDAAFQDLSGPHGRDPQDAERGSCGQPARSFTPDQAWSHATLRFRQFHGVMVKLWPCQRGAALQIIDGSRFYNVRQIGKDANEWCYDAFSHAYQGDLNTVLDQVEADLSRNY